MIFFCSLQNDGLTRTIDGRFQLQLGSNGGLSIGTSLSKRLQNRVWLKTKRWTTHRHDSRRSDADDTVEREERGVGKKEEGKEEQAR